MQAPTRNAHTCHRCVITGSLQGRCPEAPCEAALGPPGDGSGSPPGAPLVGRVTYEALIRPGVCRGGGIPTGRQHHQAHCFRTTHYTSIYFLLSEANCKLQRKGNSIGTISL